MLLFVKLMLLVLVVLLFIMGKVAWCVKGWLGCLFVLVCFGSVVGGCFATSQSELFSVLDAAVVWE